MSRVGEGTPRKLPGAKNKLFAVTHLGPFGSVKPLPACSSLVPVVPAAAQGKKKKSHCNCSVSEEARTGAWLPFLALNR